MTQAMSDRSYHLSWDQLHKDTSALAQRLGTIRQWDVIVAITRGGLVPAAIVAHALNMHRIETLGIASYGDDNAQGDIKLIKFLNDEVLAAGQHGSGVLIIDDLVDTGKTARVVRDMMPKAHFATVYAKPEGIPLIDSFIREVGQEIWIYFPWDKGPIS